MKLTLRRDLGGYALDTLSKSGIDGTVIDKPFVLLTGPNGSGKSGIMRGIRASMGLRGERLGNAEVDFGNSKISLADATVDGQVDVGMLATHVEIFRERQAAKHVPATFDIVDLGWSGQETYLFDSREASGMAKKASLEDDIAYHVSLIAGGGGQVSHGQFVSKTWWEAIEWACGTIDISGGWNRARPDAFHKAVIGDREQSAERWLFIDEPETALDAEALLLGISTLIQAAEIGRLRVFCASHSLVFAAGLARHEKIQIIDMGGQSPWLSTQETVLSLAGDQFKIDAIGKDILSKIKARRENI